MEHLVSLLLACFGILALFHAARASRRESEARGLATELEGRLSAAKAEAREEQERLATLVEAQTQRADRYFESIDRAIRQKEEWCELYHAVVARYRSSSQIMLREINRLAALARTKPKPVFSTLIQMYDEEEARGAETAARQAAAADEKAEKPLISG